MGTQATSPNQIISVPKGGGAQHGIGEKFLPDLHTGTGNFSVPIALPAGRNGFQPQLNLAYSTGNGNGHFGLGWSLSIPGVTRKSSAGIPRYHDDADALAQRDTFILSGAEDLVPLNELPRALIRYCPRTEGLFARIEHHRDAAGNFWRVASKDGLVSFYGTPRPTQAGATWSDAATIAKRKPAPADPDRIFAWKLTLTQDAFGNRIEYLYEDRDRSSDADRRLGHDWDQPLLTQIRYVDYESQGRTKFLVTVEFEYEARPDPFSEYRAGFETRTTKRCRAIQVKTHADQEYKVRRYEFHYDNDALNGASHLRAVHVIGFDDQGNPSEELPPLEFSYTGFDPQDPKRRDFYPVQGADLPASSLANPALGLVDLFGNGLPDILEMNGSVRYWRNLGNGRFDIPRTMEDAPAGLALADAGVQLIDANGDGRTDLLVTQPGLSGYFPLQFGAKWDRRSMRKYEVAPSFNLKDPEVHFVDLTGDGVTDVVRSGTRLECFFNDPKEGWHETRSVERKAQESFPNVNFSDPRVKWADMSGDGLQDIALVYDGNVEYWPNLGYGDWGKRIHMRESPRFPLDYDPKRILVGDVDGDGLADLVYVDDRKIHLWINQSGNAWGEEIVIHGTPPVSDMDAVRLVDLLGSGIAGILWTRDAALSRRDHYFFLDLTGGAKPYLLHQMDNNIGAVTKIGYAPSTLFYLDDEKNPKTRWGTPLPFPVQVVARVEVIDEVSRGKHTTEYAYRHGYWDGTEREFRGFGMVAQTDTESFTKYGESGLHGAETRFAAVDLKHYSAPTLTKTWFHQGPVGEVSGNWAERDYSDEYWTDDPQLLRHTDRVNAFLGTLPQRQLKRDALRTLRGSVLRTEIYALDSSTLEARPYTVTERAYDLREEEPPADTLSSRRRLFFPLAVAERTTQWERGEDPHTVFSYTGDYDLYGQPRSQTGLAMPRLARQRRNVAGAVVGQIAPDETRILLTHTVTAYCLPNGNQNLHNRVRQTHSFELAADATMDDTAADTAIQTLGKQRAKAEAWLTRIGDALRNWQPGAASPADLRLIAHAINYYDGAAFQGRSDDRVDYGALTRSEVLLFTDAVLAHAYTLPGDDRRPDYLRGGAALPAGPPAISAGAAQLGYRYESGADGLHQAGHYADTARNQYDFQRTDVPPGGRPAWPRCGVLTGSQDALGNAIANTLDAYWLLSVQVRDAVGLETRSIYNYRLLQPHSLTDPSGNSAHVRYSPLGLPIKQWAESKPDAQGVIQGGREAEPDVEFRYDFFAHARTRGGAVPEPIYAHSSKRVWHASDNKPQELIEVREYSDGFGRRVQTRVQAEDRVFGDNGDDVGLPLDITQAPGAATATAAADSVVVSGWQTYDNKGNVVEKFEPFFSRGWSFQGEADAKRGRHAEMYYDPRGHVLRTVNPDGSQQRVIYGRPLAPVDLALTEAALREAMPPGFAPTPWETCTYDANDLAPVSRSPVDNSTLAARAPAGHSFTPTSHLTDAMGRSVCQIARNGVAPADWHVTRSTYDIQGNLLGITDALGRAAFTHAFDLMKRQLRVTSIDAGVRTTVPDALGKPVEYRDSKGSIAVRRYDTLNRLTEVWARDESIQNMTLRELVVYGDALDHAANRALNRLGKPAEHFDEAGKLIFDDYDFKGNLLGKTREIVSDTALAAGWVADWSAASAENALDATRYETGSAYDALNRPIEIKYPRTVATAQLPARRARLTPRYNRAGALQAVTLDGDTYVDHIAYNAKGQRVLIGYGNGLMTRYAYDPDTFRLARLRTESCTRTAERWTATGRLLQNCAYSYDLDGNITAFDERVANCGVTKPGYARDRLLRTFAYDPLYRLLSATGRACIDNPETRRRQDLPNCGFFAGTTATPDQSNAPDLSEPYVETFRYDPAGNMLELAHARAGVVAWRRLFAMGGVPAGQWAAAPSNRPTGLSIGQTDFAYEFDPNGNLLRQNTEQFHGWDYADRMIGYRRQIGATTTTTARYLYGADGIRVKKWVRENASTKSTVYIDDLFEHHRSSDIVPGGENNTLHVQDNQSRIALVRVGDAHGDDKAPAVLYHLKDHLDSSGVVVSDSGDWINREEYFAYGETSIGSFARKRFRYAGKERDEESGLSCHGARYCALPLARWISCDPAGPVDGSNLYRCVRNNPLRYVDRDGNQASDGGAASDHGPPTTGKETSLPVAPAKLDKARVCITGNESKAEFERKLRVWVTAGTAIGRDANLAAKADNPDDFYALHDTAMRDAANDLSEAVCGDSPFSTLVAGTYSKKEGVKVSNKVTDPAIRTATRAHEIYHALTDEFLETVSREKAGKILDPQKYSVKQLQANLSVRADLEIDIRRCNEFIAYQVTVGYLLPSLSEQDKQDASALLEVYGQQRDQRLFSRYDSQEGVDSAVAKCYTLLPSRFSYDAKADTATLIQPWREMPRDTQTIQLSR